MSDYFLLRQEIRKLSSPKRAKIFSRFFKSGKGEYAEGDVFLGVPVPLLRNIARKYEQIKHEDVLRLLQSRYHEERFVALVVWSNQFSKGDKLIRIKIFKDYLKFKSFINNWDLVDVSAHKIVGEYCLSNDNQILFDLANSKKLFERRIAVVATLAHIKAGRPRIIYDLSKKLFLDKEDLIHKAMGWMLRESGKHCSSSRLEKFIETNISLMPRTTLRYAIERMNRKKRKHFLSL
jgi:3-methyladenine DNA glycosylase AlkD